MTQRLVEQAQANTGTDLIADRHGRLGRRVLGVTNALIPLKKHSLQDSLAASHSRAAIRRSRGVSSQCKGKATPYFASLIRLKQTSGGGCIKSLLESVRRLGPRSTCDKSLQDGRGLANR